MGVCATDCLNERVWRRSYRNLLTIARPEYIKDPTFVGVPAPGVVNPAAYLGGGTYFVTFPGGANSSSRSGYDASS